LQVQQACARHLADLERAKDPAYPYRWDKAKGNHVCAFGELMVHVKGKWVRQRIRLEDWQCFFLALPFGWVRKSDGLRRFREIYAEIPRKNAKSTMAAIIALYMTFADDEGGAEAYSGATTLKQAMHVFKTAWLMVSLNPQFQADMDLELMGTSENPGTIYRMSDNARFAPVVGQPGDGASPSLAIVDEYHEHPTPVLYDTMKTGMGARTQPMLLVITTAGTDISAPCFDLHQKAVNVLKGTIQDETFFAIIYGLDEADDWKVFANWKKANPNFGVSVFEDYLRTQYNDAMQLASKQNINQTKHLNRWMNAGNAWMNMARWAKCARPELKPEHLAGRRCWLGMDLASKIDMAALVAVVEMDDNAALPIEDRRWSVFSKAYLPEETVTDRKNSHYRDWREKGLLTVTEGAVLDFAAIEADAEAWAKLFNVVEMDYDPKEATYFIQHVQQQDWASFECVEVPQHAAHISAPMKELEGLVAETKLLHDDNPVFNWMIGNVVLKQTKFGPVKYYYPTKDSQAAKIDGPVALIMALKRALIGGETSVYEERGLLTF
jgi:phage terminase large subunit-like protein